MAGNRSFTEYVKNTYDNQFWAIAVYDDHFVICFRSGIEIKI